MSLPAHRLERINHDPALRRVWTLMDLPRCYLVGGYLRDLLLGRPSNDLDFAVEASAAATGAPARRLAAALGTRPHLLGSEPRCIWRIETAALKVELWPMDRLDLEADIRRRDFTCNALVWELPRSRLIDLVGGFADIESRTLRAVSQANLADDPVRLLRAARFLAALRGFALEPQTAVWIRDLAPQLAHSPKERIGQELPGLLAAPHAPRGLQAMIDLGLLVPAAPNEARPDASWLAHNLGAATRLADAHQHPLRTLARNAGAAARLALLLRAWQIRDPRLVAAYSWPQKLRVVAARAAELVDDAIATVHEGASARRLFIHQAGTAFPAVLVLGAALAAEHCSDIKPWRSWYRQWCRVGEGVTGMRPLLSAAEIAAICGVSPGPELGKHIRALVAAQVRGEVRSEQGARRWLHGSHL